MNIVVHLNIVGYVMVLCVALNWFDIVMPLIVANGKCFLKCLDQLADLRKFNWKLIEDGLM